MKARIALATTMLRRRFGHPRSPSVFIVGAQKAGTTSLANLFAQDQRFGGALWKELRFFNLDYHYKKGRAYYETLFSDADGQATYFDATPEYLYYPDCAERIAGMYPESKIIILLR